MTFANPVSQAANQVRPRLPQGLLGLIAYAISSGVETINAVNSAGQVAQVGTIVVDTATNSATYTWTIEGEELTYVADSSTSKIEIAAGIVLAINDNPFVNQVITAVSDGVDTVTMTARIPGQTFTASDDDAKLTTTEASTAAAEASEIAFGRLVVQTGYNDNLSLKVALPVSTLLVAQVDTITVDYAASEIYGIDIAIGGQTYGVLVTADTDDATTATAIRTAINAMMPANTVVATGATDQVILTSEIKGQPFKTSITLKTGTTARAALVNTVSSVLSDITRAMAGISVLRQDIPYTTVGQSSLTYPANSAMTVLRRGRIWVASSQTIATADPVYVETSGASAGLFYNTSSSTRILLPNARWERDERSDNGQSLAVLAWN